MTAERILWAIGFGTLIGTMFFLSRSVESSLDRQIRAAAAERFEKEFECRSEEVEREKTRLHEVQSKQEQIDRLFDELKTRLLEGGKLDHEQLARLRKLS